MTVKELRIGNLVQYQDEDVEIFKVVQISKKMISVENNIESCHLDIEAFEPIQLTEEWLLKFGFYENENGFFRLDFCNMYFLYKYNYGFSFCKNNLEIECYSHFTVNQLQNLYFALTGEELKINL